MKVSKRKKTYKRDLHIRGKGNLQTRPTNLERETYRRDQHVWEKTHELADHAEDQDEGEHTKGLGCDIWFLCVYVCVCVCVCVRL